MSSYSSSTTSVHLDQPPEDTISDLCFANNKPYLAATSWDGTIRIWDVNYTQCKALFKSTFREKSKTSLLRCCFTGDGDSVLFSNTNNEVKLLKICDKEMVSPTTIISQNTSPIVGMKYLNDRNQIIVGTMSGSIGVFDVQANGALVSVHDIKDTCVVNFDLGKNSVYCALSGRKICQIDLRSSEIRPAEGRAGTLKVNQMNTSIPSMITSIAAAPDDTGYIAGCITGHVEWSFPPHSRIEPCHRNDNSKTLYSSNCVAISSERPIGMSVGGDGQLAIFSFSSGKKNRETKISSSSSHPLTNCAFAPKGDIYAVAQGEDWSRGAESHKREKVPVQVYLRKLAQSEIN